MKHLIFILLTFFATVAHSQIPADTISVAEQIKTNKEIRNKSLVFFGLSTIPISIGGAQIMNGDYAGGLFFMSAGLIMQIAGIIVDMDRPSKELKKTKVEKSSF